MAVVSFEPQKEDGKEAGTRKVRGGKTIETVAVPAYDYRVAKITPVEGDTVSREENGQKVPAYSKTFVEVFNTLFKGDYNRLTKCAVKGWNYFEKKNARPVPNAKELSAQRILAESLGMSLAEFQALLASKKK